MIIATKDSEGMVVGMWKKLMLLALCLQLSCCLRMQHSYFSLETVEFLDRSQSMMELNKCKDECLQMKQFFPFSFRYHRLVIRQTNGMVKYFVGHCQVLMLTQRYQNWASLKPFIDSTNLFGPRDVLNQGQATIWQNYDQACESPRLQLSPQALKSMQLTRHHSNFYYYDNGQFENAQPFDDIGGMLANITRLA